jgi:hypothetical protein
MRCIEEEDHRKLRKTHGKVVERAKHDGSLSIVGKQIMKTSVDDKTEETYLSYPHEAL